MTKIERLLLAPMGFNSNLVQFLPLYYVIISNVHVCSFTGWYDFPWARMCT